MKLQTAIDRIEKSKGFDDASAPVKEAWDTIKNRLQKMESAVSLAEDWANDQRNWLTDGEICISALKDIRRLLRS